jgi:flagellar basal-body rod protein FlgB
MSIDFSKAVAQNADALHWRGERTKVLASNIANENTPGYQARDIDFGAVMRQSSSLQPDGLLPDGGNEEALYRVPFHAAQDGNTVELGVEQAAFSQNAMDFNSSLTFLNMKLKGLAKAINGQ